MGDGRQVSDPCRRNEASRGRLWPREAARVTFSLFKKSLTGFHHQPLDGALKITAFCGRVARWRQSRGFGLHRVPVGDHFPRRAARAGRGQPSTGTKTVISLSPLFLLFGFLFPFIYSFFFFFSFFLLFLSFFFIFIFLFFFLGYLLRLFLYFWVRRRRAWLSVAFTINSHRVYYSVWSFSF